MATFVNARGQHVTGTVLDYMDIGGGFRIVHVTQANGVVVPVYIDETLTVQVA